MTSKETIKTRIWRETPEVSDPYSASACYCHGYDVYGDLLGKADWIEYLFLLFMGERPDKQQVELLRDLAIAIANPGPRDHSVMAAMNGGVGGSDSAACLMAALATGAGQLGGAREVALSMELWNLCGTNLPDWKRNLSSPQRSERADVWPVIGHPPGFDPHKPQCPTPVRMTLQHLAVTSSCASLQWLQTNRMELEAIAGCSLSMSGVAAAAFNDLGMNVRQGEMIYLLLRLPGAAVHAIEQYEIGFRNFPFYRNAVHLVNDPMSGDSMTAGTD